MDPSTWLEILGASQIALGRQTSSGYVLDPKHLCFTLARYKFVAKMASSLGLKSAVEVGCGDGFPTPIVAQSVESVLAIDVESRTLENRAHNPVWDSKIKFMEHDVLSGPVPGGPYQLAYSLDVIEHIYPEFEESYLNNIVASLDKRSAAIIGTPNKAAEAYQSKHSRDSHFNLKSHDALRDAMSKRFEYVLMFGMNDEVVHTGFPEMCHYLMAVGLNPLHN